MAFKTSASRTAAIGHGTMSIITVLWWFSCLTLVAPAALLLEYAAWFALPALRTDIENLITLTAQLVFLCLFSLLVVHAFLVMITPAVFAGPRNVTRDRIAILARSRTARWCGASSVLAGAIVVLPKMLVSDATSFVVLALAIAFIWAMIRAALGLSHIYRTNRAAAYFTGMTDAEKNLADQPSTMWERPSFPMPANIYSADDANRYARRAKSIAEAHVWFGAGIVVIVSAFIGTSFSSLWEASDPSGWIPAYLVVGTLALGFWIQRRARNYENLRDQFEARGRELELAATTPTTMANRIRTLFERLKIRRRGRRQRTQISSAQ